MSYQIALTFEDGVTRFIECRDEETVADASYRSRINIPLDCRDGVCGTCKSFCESGRYELGEYVPDEAMTEEEEAEGYVLTCQMVPQSDCVVRIFASSDVAKTGPSAHQGRISAIQRLSDSTLTFTVELDGGQTARVPARPVRQHRRARHRSDALVFLQFAARPYAGVLPASRHPHRRTAHVPAGADRGRPSDRVPRAARHLLPARHQAPGAVPGRRHRARPVHRHARHHRSRQHSRTLST